MIEIFTTILLLIISAYGIYIKIQHENEIDKKVREELEKSLKSEVEKRQTAPNEILSLIRQRRNSISNETPLQTGVNISLEDIKKAFEQTK